MWTLIVVSLLIYPATWGQEMLAYLDCQYPDVYLPICGSDGKDYFNFGQLLCIASKHPERDLTLQHMYPCSCHGILENDKESPVCTSDSHTFPSRAAFECIKVFTRDSKTSVLSDGTCEGGKVDECWAQKLPPTLWKPVCGTDELTYFSLWHLRCANSLSGKDIKMEKNGTCPCKVSLYYKPLCGSNNVTYPNLEMFQCDQHLHNLNNITVLREGHCEWSEDSSCEDRVPQFDESLSNGLCASDGITYLTAEQFKCIRKTKQDLKLLHDGPCKVSEIPKEISPQEACTNEATFPVKAPVCGSDNVTYMSIYSLLCTSLNKTGLKFISEGECGFEMLEKIDPCSHQDKSYMPLCGANNVTYSNSWEFQCDASNITGLIVHHIGECNKDSNICKTAALTASLDMPHICASDGNTYVNLFAFWCVKQDNPDLEVSHFDECV